MWLGDTGQHEHTGVRCGILCSVFCTVCPPPRVDRLLSPHIRAPSPPTPFPRPTTPLLSVSTSLSLIAHVSEVTWFLAFLTFISLRMTFSRSAHGAANGRVSPFLVAEQDSSVNTDHIPRCGIPSQDAVGCLVPACTSHGAMGQEEAAGHGGGGGSAALLFPQKQSPACPAPDGHEALCAGPSTDTSGPLNPSCNHSGKCLFQP